MFSMTLAWQSQIYITSLLLLICGSDMLLNLLDIFMESFNMQVDFFLVLLRQKVVKTFKLQDYNQGSKQITPLMSYSGLGSIKAHLCSASHVNKQSLSFILRLVPFDNRVKLELIDTWLVIACELACLRTHELARL